MYQLNLPTYDLRLRRTGNRDMIFDVLRRKYVALTVALTPEEWVRQHFVHFLIEHKGYPTALLANEIELRIGEKHLRADTLLYNKELRPHMLIEYKSPTIALTQKVFDQISAYNLLLHADYLIVSNGMQHICCRMDYEQNTYHFLEEIPDYSEL